MTIHVTIVDDNHDNLESYRELLEEDFDLKLINNPLELIDFLETQETHLLLLDLHMPQMNGFEVYQLIKERYPNLPTVFLSGDPSEDSVVQGLNLGASDFIVKPITAKELVARIKNRISLSSLSPSPFVKPIHLQAVKLGNLTIFCDLDVVHLDGKVINFTPTEFKILGHFARNLGRVISKEEIIEHLYTLQTSPVQSLEAHISNIKKKLSNAEVNIKSIRRVGYILPKYK